MPRNELVGLLDTMTPAEHQRVTAQIRAATPDEIADKYSPKPVWIAARIAVIAASFIVTCTIGLVLVLL